MLPADGRRLADFMPTSEGSSVSSAGCPAPYAPEPRGRGRRVYLETYGCQMNVSDTEIVRAVLSEAHFQEAKRLKEADVVLLMTCAIREGAEQKIRERIKALGKDMIGRVLGCMAERLKTRLLKEEPLVSLIAGPDSYRDLPRLLANIHNPVDAVNVLLSLDETYADIQPMRRQRDSVSAFLSIMRGCDNMCTYCIVPFTRGRERSRPIDSILDNARSLAGEGVKEITLLGQNVNSYRDLSVSTHYGSAPSATKAETSLPGFSTVYKPKMGGRRFVDLLEAVSSAVPDVRIRFTSPHPKDFPIEVKKEYFRQVLELMRERSNLCKQLHLPAQSGDDAVLAAMGRGYTRDTYLQLVQRVRSILGQEVCLTSDFIAGFCGETEAAHEATLHLIRRVRYDFAYCFAYSMREVCLTSDFIAGFCGETEAAHEATLHLIRRVRYDFAYCFAYSMREVCLTSDFIAGFCGETEAAHEATLHLIRRVRYDFAYCFAYSMREVCLTSDFIAGFCGETEAAHEATLHLIRRVRYDFAYCFAYSMREVCLTSDFIAGFCGETEAAHEATLHLIRRVRYDFAYCFAYSMREVCLTSDFIAGFCGETEAAHEATLHLIRRVRYDFAYCFAYSMREVCLTSDFIAGFCGETEAAHEATLHLIRRVRYDFAYCFAYSMREVCLTSDFIAGFCGETEAAHEATLHLIRRVRYDFAYCFAYSMREVCLTSDFIAGFCGETEAAHEATLHLIRRVRYDFAYCFAYSMREVCLTSDFIAGFCGETEAAHEATLHLTHEGVVIR